MCHFRTLSTPLVLGISQVPLPFRNSIENTAFIALRAGDIISKWRQRLIRIDLRITAPRTTSVQKWFRYSHSGTAPTEFSGKKTLSSELPRLFRAMASRCCPDLSNYFALSFEPPFGGSWLNRNRSFPLRAAQCAPRERNDPGRWVTAVARRKYLKVRRLAHSKVAKLYACGTAQSSVFHKCRCKLTSGKLSGKGGTAAAPAAMHP